MIKYNLAWIFSSLFVLALYLAWLAQKIGIAPSAPALSNKLLRILWVGVAFLPASIVWLLTALVAMPRHLEYYEIIVSFLPFFTSVLMGGALGLIWITDQILRSKEPLQK